MIRKSSSPTALLRCARIGAGLSLRAAARRAGTSHSTLLAYEQGTKVPALSTYLRLLRALGYAVDIELSPRISEIDGYPRGEELEAALELAAEFPSRHNRQLVYPRFGTG